MEDRVILHSDLNSFYASVEMMLDPSLRGKAVAVCGSTEDRHGIVLARYQDWNGELGGSATLQGSDCSTAPLRSVSEVFQDDPGYLPEIHGPHGALRHG